MSKNKKLSKREIEIKEEWRTGYLEALEKPETAEKFLEKMIRVYAGILLSFPSESRHIIDQGLWHYKYINRFASPAFIAEVEKISFANYRLEIEKTMTFKDDTIGFDNDQELLDNMTTEYKRILNNAPIYRKELLESIDIVNKKIQKKINNKIQNNT